MSEEQPRPMRQVFKGFEVITADNAEQMGRAVTAMLLANPTFQLYGPTMCVAKGNGIEYFQALICHEYVMAPVEPMPMPVAPESPVQDGVVGELDAEGTPVE